ncbi:Ser/Thr phosphatase family protein [Phocaeicola plebeius DSM 17135]|uniref:Ser/Thr phosphatase family protein n=1 Tax=Phocaeicola plebeius (strain DSM 17135 / JCM 12973 / CCUG 54634 / M2) TaxID=484018 RepID=B5CZ95_PHOPM|nr:metallophosphoesterase [Phocaeicola plebeius]EDY95776.1 Ser/Thr phosphatase family protein [Phocaeicola plebeius DSM 17135]
MSKMIKLCLVACLWGIMLLGNAQTQIAFISDAHIQDVDGHAERVRSMEVQVQSTRLFNENYYALLAALDDVARRNIRWVVLPGDLTDNGQFFNQQKIKNILHSYTQRKGMRFFVTTGNHDPALPLGLMQKNAHFLAADGSRVTREDSCAGYVSQMECYADFGFFPRKDDCYWESPFTSYTYDKYSYEDACRESVLSKRTYTLCDSLTATDASYLVEPVDGLWLLAIDGGVYLPKEMKDGKWSYQGSSAGYNLVLKHKPFLLPWVRKVVEEAQKRHKTLVSFSHYPLVDFNDGVSEHVRRIWGDRRFDLHRVPEAEVSEAFLQAGLRLHFAGHMHVNDTGIWEGKDGKHLYNIQVPSIATYVPAYKILTIESDEVFRVETVALDTVPGFDSLFPLYRAEYQSDSLKGHSPVWNKEILSARTYGEFCDYQFRDLVRLRFIPRDLPESWRACLDFTGARMLEAVSGEDKSDDADWTDWCMKDLVLDLYRLRYAERLALEDIPRTRLAVYRYLFDRARISTFRSAEVEMVKGLGTLFLAFLNGEPCQNFVIDLKKDAITED